MAVRLAIVFHFHEPMLVDPATGRAALPWVRLRAIKDYYGTIEFLRRFQGLRFTIGLSSSLVRQLEALPEDEHAVLARRRPKDLTREEVSLLLDRLFYDDFVGRIERYSELRRKRDSEERFSHQELRDLQILSTLAWAHPLAFDSREDLTSLRRKGSMYDENDKRLLFDACAEIAREILPGLSELGRSGRVELASSTYHHPVLPLLCSPPFPGAPDATEDAREQLARAKELHARVFGSSPVGLWPPELALSDRALSAISEAGYDWTIAEGNAAGDRARTVGQGGGIAVVMRNRRLSEFAARGHGGVGGRSAAAEFVSMLLRAEDNSLAVLALEGGRTWDSHSDCGYEFLNSLFGLLEREPRVKVCTMSEAASEGHGPIEDVEAYGWSESDLSRWSSEAPWRDLFAAREVAMKRETGHALEAVLAAEASDWFAAAGDENTPFREDYLALFRAHLDCASTPEGRSRVTESDGGLMAGMSFRIDGKTLAIEVTPATGKGTELSRRRLELRVVEPIEARIAVAGLETRGRLFVCDIEGRPRGKPFGEAHLGETLALRVPLDAIGASSGETAFYVALVDEEKVVERLPPRGPAWVG